MIKNQKPFWLVLLAAWDFLLGTSAYQLCLKVPPPVAFYLGFPPSDCSPFGQPLEQGSLGGFQSQGSPFSPLDGTNGLLGFGHIGPYGLPTFGCPPINGYTSRPFRPFGNGIGPVNSCFGLNNPYVSQGNAHYQQELQHQKNQQNCMGYPSISFNCPEEQYFCDEDNEQNQQSTRYSSKIRTTKKPRSQMGKKIRIV